MTPRTPRLAAAVQRRGPAPCTMVLAAGIAVALLCPVTSVVAQPASARERVELDAGVVEGLRDGALAVFKGIPYAAPPIGPRRWRPPQPVEPWQGVRRARSFSPMAPQPYAASLGLVTSEDCLYLNVWSPARAGDSLPVMVWFHGGGFSTGSASEPLYDGTELAKLGVVVVSFNYRLGVFGFFAHPLLTDESPQAASGNYGLMDQIAALRWVRQNIGAFGGDPERVTIFGESAGGRAVSLLMASPHARGLFHRAAAQSGSLRGVGTPLADRAADGLRVTQAMGCADREHPLRCLRSKIYAELGPVADAVSGPIVDGWVIPEDPRVVYAEGRQHDVPVIIGGNADEGTFFMIGRRDPVRTVTDYEAFVRDELGEHAEPVLAMYAAAEDDEVYAVLTRFLTDRGVLRHARQQARWMAATAARTYVYLFARVSPQHRWSGLGATHTAELPYLFGNLQFAAARGRLSTLERVDRQLSQTMMRYWVQFATTGDPNGDGRPEWPAYTSGRETVLVLDAEVRPGSWPREDGLDLFDRLPDEPAP